MELYLLKLKMIHGNLNPFKFKELDKKQPFLILKEKNLIAH